MCSRKNSFEMINIYGTYIRKYHFLLKIKKVFTIKEYKRFIYLSMYPMMLACIEFLITILFFMLVSFQ